MDETLFPYRIEIYLTLASEKPEFIVGTDELIHDDARKQGNIILRRFMADRVKLVPIVIAGRWYRKTEDEVREIIDNLTMVLVAEQG
jgi:hypothetical protein